MTATIASCSVMVSARLGAAPRSTLPGPTAGSTSEARASPRAWLVLKKPTSNGSESTAAPTSTARRATTLLHPKVLARASEAGPSSTAAPTTIATRTATSASSSQTRRLTRERDPAGCVRRSRSNQVSYSAANVCSGLGSLRSTQDAAGPDARMSHGVVRVVIAETATATG